MIIIAFEGIDKSGKASQSEMLYQALYELGYSVEKSEFHRYDTPTGKLIRSFLDGEYSPNQLAIECIMAADKYAQLDWFKELEEETDILILDRYVASQIVYSKANGIDTDFTINLLEDLPEPDFHIFLDIDPEESMRRKGEHGENDKYESNGLLLKKAREIYLRVMKVEEEDNRAVVIDGKGSVADIHKQVLDSTLNLLEKKKVA